MTVPGRRATVALGALFALLSTYAWWAGRADQVPGPVDKPRFIAQEEQRVRAALTDPESARFRAEVIGGDATARVLCGEVNARNPLGGYAGYERFVAGAGKVERATVVGAERMDALWAEQCAAAEAAMRNHSVAHSP